MCFMYVSMLWIIFYHTYKKTKDLFKKNHCLGKWDSKNNFESTDIVLIIYTCEWVGRPHAVPNSSNPLKGFTLREKIRHQGVIGIHFLWFSFKTGRDFSRFSTLLFDLISCSLKPVSITVTDTLNLLWFSPIKQPRWYSVRFLASKPHVLETDLTVLLKIPRHSSYLPTKPLRIYCDH